jgi:hypothetical protein
MTGYLPRGPAGPAPCDQNSEIQATPLLKFRGHGQIAGQGADTSKYHCAIFTRILTAIHTR